MWHEPLVRNPREVLANDAAASSDSVRVVLGPDSHAVVLAIRGGRGCVTDHVLMIQLFSDPRGGIPARTARSTAWMPI